MKKLTAPHPARAIGACLAASLALGASHALASSHREAPFIAKNEPVDGTDLYMFRSYEGGRADYVTLLANYIPFQDPQGGPNFFHLDANALYEIHIDNDGDAKEDITFQFRFKNTSKGQTLRVGDKDVQIPLINSGTLPRAINPDTLNVRETYTVDVVRGGRRGGDGGRHRLTNADGGGDEFDKPVDNIGEKTFGSRDGYAAYYRRHVYKVAIPGCDDHGRLFVGQRKESFYIAVGKIFDLFNLDPLGAENANNNDLEAKNITTLALEVPIACLVSGDDPVIGAFTTSNLRQVQLLKRTPGLGWDDASRNGGAWTQVSRLGMPLVNEVVIGLDFKNRFNASKPADDAQFLDFVTNPTLPALLQTLFPVQAPTNFPRTDLVAAFLTGIAGLNQPKHVTPSEMLRLNTSLPPKSRETQSPLGVAGGDNAGFPNGRRPGDDVVDLSLRVAMGALCVLTGPDDMLKVGCAPNDAPSGNLAFTDGVRRSATDYEGNFPYLKNPIPGNFNPPAPAGARP